jgi:23S rRNA (cytosine1962-C5)-methyltransferase
VPDGSLVTVKTRDGRTVGKGFYNARSMITVRIVVWGHAAPVDADLIYHRIQSAVEWRRMTAAGRDAFRVVFSEADGLPGLVVDKYGPMLVMEVTSLGMTRFMDAIVSALCDTLNPLGIYEHGDLAVREREGLPRENRLVWGELVPTVEIHEHGVAMSVNVAHGQKTGHFLDQYSNRGRVRDLAGGRQVFDAFCHTGGFALQAANGGAQSVVGIDIDPQAVQQASNNALANGMADKVRFEADNAFDWLRRQSDGGPQYDLGILDPPAFTKSKASLPGALKGYKEINLRAIKLLRPGGILVTSSCSYHVSELEFIAVVGDAAHDARRHVRILEIRGQGPDHPVLPALGESRYLKCLILGID